MRLTNWFSYYMRTVFDPFGFVQALNLGYCIHHSDSHLYLCSLHTFQKYRIGRSYISSEVMFHISCKHWSWQQEKLVSTNSFLDFNSLTNSCIRLSLLRTGSYPFAALHHCFQPLIWCFYRQSSKWKASIFHKVLEIDFLLGTGAGGRGGGLSDFCWVTIIYLIPQEAPRWVIPSSLVVNYLQAPLYTVLATTDFPSVFSENHVISPKSSSFS